MQTVGFYHFGVLVIAAGKDVAGNRVIDHQMVSIRACRRLIFGDHSVVNDTDGTFTESGHTVTQRMDSLHDCAGQSRFRAAAIFGGHFYLFACQLVQRSRKLSGEVKEVVDRNTHDSIPFLIRFIVQTRFGCRSHGRLHRKDRSGQVPYRYPANFP